MIARRTGQVTEFGKLADPIADKALTGTALVALSVLELLPWWVTLTIIVREVGVMAAKVVHEYPENLDEILAELAAFSVKNPVEKVTCKAPHIDTPENAERRVVLWDFGTKGGIRRELMKRGCEVVTVPASATFEEIMDFNPS